MSLNQNQTTIISNIKILDSFRIDTICISPKTFTKNICLNNKHEINKIILFNEDNIDDEYFMDKLNLNNSDKYINKIAFDKNYLFLSNSNLLYEINDNVHNKIFGRTNNLLKSCFKNENIRYLIVLDNKNIVANAGENKICFFNFVNGKYEKFFNNINKYGEIIGLMKLDNNEFCFLSKKYGGFPIISKFDEGFYSVEKTLTSITCNENNISNLIFKISNKYIVIVGSNNFAIFNVKFFEINTIIETDEIISSLNMNWKNLNKDEYEYMALITRKDKNYNLQIYKFEDNSIKGVDKINLIEYSSEEYFENTIDENKNEKKEKKIKEKYILLKRKDITEFILKSKDDFFEQSGISFDINYDIKNNGNIIFIIGINCFPLKKRLVALFEANLENMNFK